MHVPLLSPLILGHKRFDTSLIQAPLAGVSAAPFRELIAVFGAAAYCCTEMISAKTLLNRPPLRYIHKSKQEGLLCFQLSGNTPSEMQQAATIAAKHGADLLDINCGCPVEKIRKKGCGSKLLSMSHTLGQMIRAIKAEVDLPLTVKIRVDGASGERFNQEVTHAINDAGADGLIVHGRHWSEHYETPVRLEEIAAIVAASDIPVIGNGDVKDYASLQRMLAVTGCQGVMIGRASVGRPWLFAQLWSEAQGHIFTPPSPAEIGALFLRHIEALSHLENETLALLQARSLSKYYLRAAALPESLQAQFTTLTQFEHLQDQVRIQFENVGQMP
jgi:tRNA-dihydrouridine synthase B